MNFKLQASLLLSLFSVLLFATLGQCEVCEAPSGSKCIYVSQSVQSSGNGSGWTSALRDTTNITWGGAAGANAGDFIYLDGGVNEYTYAPITTGAGGSSGKPLTIKRSSEAGHNGSVTVGSPTIIQNSYITIDGGDYNLFFINTDHTRTGKYPSGQGYPASSLNVMQGSDFFEIRNTSFLGNYAAGTGHSLGIDANTAVISRCRFVKSAWEDQIQYRGNTSLTILGSQFLDNPFVGNPATDPHRDMLNIWESGGFALTVRGNYFRNLSVVFLMQNTSALKSSSFTYNVYNSVDTPLQFGSGNQGGSDVSMYNNVFYDISNRPIYGNFNGIFAAKNNIFKMRSSSNFSSDGGSISDPLFTNPAAIFGADLIPFTADDGFSLTKNSAARNAGVPVGLSSDILGNSIIGAPDLGAFEFWDSVGTPAPSAPGNLLVSQ